MRALPRPRTRRAARILALTALAVAAGQLAGTLLLDACPEAIRFPELFAVEERLGAGPGRPDIVAFGSSRFRDGLLPEAIAAAAEGANGVRPSLVNAAVPASFLPTSERLLGRMEEDGRLPGLVLLELSPEALGEKNWWAYADVLRLWTWPEIVRHLPDILRGQGGSALAGSRLIPWYRHRLEFRGWLAHALGFSRPALLLGTGAPGPPPPDVDALVASFRKRFADYRIGGATTERAVRRLLERCRRRGVEVVLVGVPLSSTYRSLYTPAVEGAFRSWVAGAERDGGCRFIDFGGRLPDELFRDGHHLNAEGAARFSRLVAQEVVVPWWRERERP